MKLILNRIYYSNGTNGILYIYPYTTLLCLTIELPWLGNKPRISCIPEGRYEVRMRYSRKYKSHLVLKDVEGRAMILIHPANNAGKELKGCIAPVTKVTGEGKGNLSRPAFEKLKSIVSKSLDREPVYLTIKS